MVALTEIKTVLVTGASGFIGRALVARLAQMGKNVVRVSRAFGLDITRDQLPLAGVDHVFHLAALTGIPTGWNDPVGFLTVNAIGTARVLEQCRLHGCGLTFVGAFTYGPPKRLPIAEDHPIEPNNVYSLSKYVGEQFCNFYYKFYNVSVVVVRIFNVYGPGQSEDFLVPRIVRQILDPNVSEIEVMDLTPRRDYVFLSDAVEGILMASGAKPGSIFNIGSGIAYSVEEMIQHASVAAGEYKPYRATNEQRVHEIDTTVADISAITESVGWRPRVTIYHGLREVIENLRGTCIRST